jgi:hypothetical protein
MRVLRRLFASERVRLEEDARLGLAADYNAERALAKQLLAHAEEAPYRQAAERLRLLAQQCEAHAAVLAEELRRLGGELPRSEPRDEPRTGKNHWARLVADLDEVRSAAKRYLEQAIEWEDELPELAERLRDLERQKHAARFELQDLIARCDPQAEN